MRRAAGLHGETSARSAKRSLLQLNEGLAVRRQETCESAARRSCMRPVHPATWGDRTPEAQRLPSREALGARRVSIVCARRRQQGQRTTGRQVQGSRRPAFRCPVPRNISGAKVRWRTTLGQPPGERRTGFLGHAISSGAMEGWRRVSHPRSSTQRQPDSIHLLSLQPHLYPHPLLPP